MKDITAIQAFTNAKSSEQKRLLQLWDKYYYEEDDPLISDETYDACLKIYNQSTKHAPYESSLGKASPNFEKFTHTYPILSLAKINTQEAYEKMPEKLGDDIIIEPKIDGLTVVYYPDGNLVSRGDGHIGEVLPNAKYIPGLPKPLKKPVRMEVCIDEHIFKQYFFDSNKNPRNTAAGILRRKEYTDDVKFLTYYAYNILGSHLSEENQLITLRQNGFKIVEYWRFNSKEKFKDFYPKLHEVPDNTLAPTDGCCIKCNNPSIALDMGSTAHHPNNMIAYKFPTETVSSKLIDVEWSRGRTTFTPVAIFESVTLGGNKIQRASLHNLKIMRQLDIKIGCHVDVTLKNEIIPQIVSTSVKNETEIKEVFIPKKCPDCNADLVINDSQELECVNKKCPHLIYDNLKRLVSKQALDITGISDANIKLLGDFFIEENIENLSAFTIKIFERSMLKKALGCTDYMVEKLIRSISSSFKEVDPASYLYACNIPLLGKNTAKDIMKHYGGNINDFIKKFEYDGKHIDGIGDTIYQSIIDNMDIIKDNLIFISSFKKKEEKSADFKVLKIAITGKLSQSRKYYQDEIEKMGHIFKTSVTKDLDYLICGEDAGSKKEKALNYGIAVITENEFSELIRGKE